MNREAEQILAATDWAALTHAYGDASDVPALFANLHSHDTKTRDKALFDLWGTVWHQGTVYSASAPAAHVLAALALDPSSPERPQLIMLLSEIARGAGYYQVHGASLHMAQAELDEVVAEEAIDVAAAHEAVKQRLPALMRLIADRDPEVRAMVPRLAVSFPNEAPLFLPTLLAALDTDPDARVRACILLALGGIGGRDPHLTKLIEHRVAAPCPENIGAAIALLWSTQTVTPNSAKILKQARRKSPEQKFIEETWGGLDSITCWLEEAWDGKPGVQGGAEPCP